MSGFHKQKKYFREWATNIYSDKIKEEYGKKAKSKLTSLTSVVNEYCSEYTEDKKEAVDDLVTEVYDASYKAVRWSWLGAGNPGKKKKEGRHEDVERYGAFSIDLGLNDAMNTDLNMSVEG